MANPILGQNNQVNFLTELEQFRKQLNGADPQQKVMELLSSDKMTQQQFEQLKAQATSIQKMFNLG